MRKLFCAMTVLVMLAVVPAAGRAQEERLYKDDIFTYVISMGNAEITNVEDSRAVVEVPAELGGAPVTALRSGAFGGSQTIREVVLPDSITQIGSMCFAYSTALQSVKLPANLQSIGDGAFYQCEGLWTVWIPEGTQSIGANAFALCSGLSAAAVPASVAEIGSGAFPASGGFRLYAKPDTAGAAYAWENRTAYEELVNVRVNGAEVVFDQPCITDNRVFRTMVPIRPVLEAMGAEITWDSSMDIAGINLPGFRLRLHPGAEFMMVNDQVRYLTCSAIEFNNRVMIPIRDVVEAVGGKVDWDEAQKLVSITYGS